MTTLQELLDVTGPVERGRVRRHGRPVERAGDDGGADANAAGAGQRPQGVRGLPGRGDAASPACTCRRRSGGRCWTRCKKLRDSKTALFYSFDPALQSLAHDMGLDGALQDPPGDYLMPVEASVNSTKLNIVIDKRMEMQVALDELGDAHSTVTLRLPEQRRRLGAGPRPGARVPADAEGPVRRLPAPVHEAAKPARGRRHRRRERRRGGGDAENGKSVFGRFFGLPKDAKREVAFQYVTPARRGAGGKTAQYRLFIQKQPGTGDVPLSLSLSLPDGAKPLSLELDGKPVERRRPGGADGPFARPRDRADLSDRGVERFETIEAEGGRRGRRGRRCSSTATASSTAIAMIM